MVKRKNRRGYSASFQRPLKKVNKKSHNFFLEEVSFNELKERKQRTEDLINYHWAYYSELAVQREAIKDEIYSVLRDKCLNSYQFKSWQRAVKYKYSLHPLSCVGSMTYIGQRFNYGKDINSNLTAFPALYLASDKDTALQETLGQTSVEESSTLSARELALGNPQSETIVSVSGELETVFDLRNSKNITKFVNLVKNFTISRSLKKEAKRLGKISTDVVTKPKQLWDTILVDEWQQHGNFYDVPSNSQIFGHILNEAGISGVLFNSRLTGKECLSIFTDNFPNTNSWVGLDDEAPLVEIPAKLDSSNSILARMTNKEVLAIKS